MSRIKLLQPHEIKEFDCPIVLTTTQQIHYFEIKDDLAVELDKLRHPCSIEKILAHIELMNRFVKAIFFGSNQMFQVATKEEQEKIILCRTLLQNAIILWNYLYLSELVSQLESQPELEELIGIIRNSTAVAWSHVNLLGGYDFTKLLNDSQLRFDLQKLKAWKYKRTA